MASGSNNLLSYKASQIIGNNTAQNPAGALLQSGAGRADNSTTGDTWIFLDTIGGTTSPWGIKHKQLANQIAFIGSSTEGAWITMNTGNAYFLGKMGIGYDPETTNNTYKLYVNGTSNFTGRIYGTTGNGLEIQSNNTGGWKEGIRVYNASNNYSVVCLCNNDLSDLLSLVHNGSSHAYCFDIKNNGTYSAINIPSGHNGTMALTDGYGASGTWGISISGNAATASKLNSRGNITCETGGNKPAVTGLTMQNVYNNGYPTTYGNVMTMYGGGAGQLLLGWSGSSTASTGVRANAYIRSQRDTADTKWSDWYTILDSGNYNDYAPTKTGGGASGTWSINVTGKARYVEGDNDAQNPGGALCRSGAGRADNSTTGDTWIFWDALGGTASPWGIRHDQGANTISFIGSGTVGAYITLNTGASKFGTISSGAITSSSTIQGTQILIPTGTTSAAASQATALSHQRLQCNNNFYINGNTDNNGDEYVIITSGKGVSSTQDDGLAVGSSNVTIGHGYLWIRAGSAAGSNTNRLTTTSGMPGNMQYNVSRRGTQIYSNGIAFCDPYNGNSNSDAGWIRHQETTSNAGELEIAVGDDGDETVVVRQYNTSNGIKRTLTLLSKDGYTFIPSYLNIGGNENNASSPPRVWGTNGSDNYLRSYQTAYLNVNSASYLRSRGNITCETGTARPAVSGVSMSQVYNNGYPTAYGNALTLNGGGCGQLLIGWSGTSGARADAFLRSKRDVSDANWSSWYTILDSGNYSSYALPLSGGTMTGTLNLLANQYTFKAGAMNCNNSNIIGINGLFFADNCESFGEGICFYRSSTTCDSIAASGGFFYFCSNKGDVALNGTNADAWLNAAVVSLFPGANGNYNEGMRIHCSNGGWATIMLCGTDNTGNQGTSANSWGIFNNNGTLYINRATSSGAGVSRVYANSSGWYFDKAYGAVWNDFAEYRQSDVNEPGRVIIPSADGIAKMSTERLQSGGRIISDTFGFSVGASDIAKTPIGVSGRVLAYPYQNKENYHIGDAVCTAPNGTVDIMTREEIIMYPERILGIVNEIPDYDIWQESLECPGGEPTVTRIEVKGRIWIDIK